MQIQYVLRVKKKVHCCLQEYGYVYFVYIAICALCIRGAHLHYDSTGLTTDMNTVFYN